MCVSRPISMKQAATLFAQSKCRPLQSIIYLKEKIFIGTSSILAWGKRWPAFGTPNCSPLHKGLVQRKIISWEIWERFQLIDISTVWQPKSNYLKRAKSGQKRVAKEMITGSLSFPFSFFPPHQLFACLLLSRLSYYLRVWNGLGGKGCGHTRLVKQRQLKSQ